MCAAGRIGTVRRATDALLTALSSSVASCSSPSHDHFRALFMKCHRFYVPIRLHISKTQQNLTYIHFLYDVKTLRIWREPSSVMLPRVDFVRTDDSERRIASIIWVIIIGELGTTLAITSNRSTLRRKIFLGSVFRFYLLINLFLADWFYSPWWWRRCVPSKSRSLQEPHGATS
jgi:hypothetical protein